MKLSKKHNMLIWGGGAILIIIVLLFIINSFLTKENFITKLTNQQLTDSCLSANSEKSLHDPKTKKCVNGTTYCATEKKSFDKMLNECVKTLCPDTQPFRNSSIDTCKSNIEMDTICRNKAASFSDKYYYINLSNDKIDLNSQCMNSRDAEFKKCNGLGHGPSKKKCLERANKVLS